MLSVGKIYVSSCIFLQVVVETTTQFFHVLLLVFIVCSLFHSVVSFLLLLVKQGPSFWYQS